MIFKNFLKKKSSSKSSGSSKLYINLRAKFFVSFIFLVILPFFIYSYITYKNSIHTTITADNKQVITNLNNTIENMKSYVKLIADDRKFQEHLQLLCSQNSISDYSLYNKRLAVHEALTRTAVTQNVGIEGIYLLYDNQFEQVLRFGSDPAQYHISTWYNTWYNQIINKPGQVRIIGTENRIYEGGRSEYVFSVAIDVPVKDKRGVLLVDFKYKNFKKMIELGRSFDNPENKLFIINEDSKIVYREIDESLTVRLDEDIIGAIAGKKSGFSKIDFEGKDSHLSFDTAIEIPWKVINIVSSWDLLLRVMTSKNMLLLPACIFLLSLLIFFIAVSSILLRPINKLTTVISHYEKGDFIIKSGSEVSSAGEDAVGISNIDNLISKVYFTKLKQKEAELSSLQSKINPHFLYNTLESIRGAALYHKIPEIAQMSKCLSLFFRYSISENVLVTLREEIDNLENYITIQNFRHDDKFEVIYNIPEKVYDYKILKLTLQPIVENCIKHGLEMKLGKGKIKIGVMNLGGVVIIEVSDDGDGIPPDRVKELNDALSKGLTLKKEQNGSTGMGIGIQNVNSRIKLYFGEQYGLKFRESQIGATVEIVFPAIEEGGNEYT
ncbi:MAG: sensor histidine kinase [Clostridia bacterium]|nr:sensor histidine kinase [Clostridia bacterium]